MSALVATLVDDRPADQEQRADRDAGVRHQPVSIGACRCCCSPSLLSGVAVRAAGAACSPTRTARPTRSNSVIRGCPAQTFGVLDRQWIVGHERRHLSLRVLRPADRTSSTALTLYHLDPQAVAAGVADLRARTSALGRAAWRRRRARRWSGRASSGWTRSSRPRRRRNAVTDRRSTTRRSPSADAAARAAQLLQDRRARTPIA